MSLLDLFVPPVVRPKSNARVHLAADERTKREKARLRMARWYAENRERRLASMKARYEANKAEYIAKARKWDRENPEKRIEIRRANSRRYRAKQKMARQDG